MDSRRQDLNRAQAQANLDALALTPDAIDALTAGPTTDALIARHVLGWILPPYSDVVGQMWVEPPHGYVHPEGPGPYSTDPTAAREVEMALIKRHLSHAYVLLLWKETGHDSRCALTDTLLDATPLQRCKAALKAVLEVGSSMDSMDTTDTSEGA